MDHKEPSPLKLFILFLKISSFTLGGGAVMIGIMEDELVHRRKWLKAEEMVDILAMVNSMPGVIGINSAVFIGKKLAGFPGALMSALGILFPSFFIILLLSGIILRIRGLEVTYYAFLGVRAGATALILLVLYRIFRKVMKGWREWFIALSAFMQIKVIGIPALWVIFISALLGWFLYRRDE